MVAQIKKRFNTKRIGELLIDRGVIGYHHLEFALDIQQKQKPGQYASSGDILIQLGYVQENDILEAFLMQYSVPYLPLDNYNINPHAVLLVPREVAARLEIMPLEILGESLTVAVANPLKPRALEEVHAVTGMHIHPCIATSRDIAKCMETHYGIINPYRSEGNNATWRGN